MRIISAAIFSFFFVFLQYSYAYSMEEPEEHHCADDDLIRSQMRSVPQDVLEKLNSSEISYFNIVDSEGKLIATVDGSSNQVYTYREVQGGTSLSKYSIDDFKVIVKADSQLKSEKKPLIIDEEYEQAVEKFGGIKRVYYPSYERDSLLNKKKKQCCWWCCLY